MGSDHILVVDDEPEICHVVAEMLRAAGAEVATALSGDEALVFLRARAFDLLLTDFHMPGMTGIELIQEARLIRPDLRAILMSAQEPARIVRDSTSQDTFDFLAKPVTTRELRLRVQRALRERDIAAAPPEQRARAALKRKDDLLVGASRALHAVLEQISIVAQSDIPVLITGESGTGKELTARTIHHIGLRYARPFVAVNCSAIPESLMEAELFGHVRGAFTGATGDREGLFAAADGGTIFLDEIGELSLAAQVKLLRVLERGEMRRVGETQDVTVDVRLVSATNRDLEVAVAQGRFREDLYYRINVFPVHLPPLRERREDVPLLAYHLLRRHAPPDRRVRLDRGAVERLLAHDWPGNVRELENVLRQALALADGDLLRSQDIRLAPARAGLGDDDLDVPFQQLKERRLGDLERDYVVAMLRRHGGNVSAAARASGLHRKNFWRLMQKAGVEGGGRGGGGGGSGPKD